MTEKKRLTLTGNKMPTEVYDKLERLGSERKLTPYISSLVQREEIMDKLISDLSLFIKKVDNIESIVVDLHGKMENITIQTSPVLLPKTNLIEPEIVLEGKLEISNRIEGGIEEEIEDADF